MQNLKYAWIYALAIIGFPALLCAEEAPINPMLNPVPFTQWLQAFESDARSQGIQQTTLDSAFSHTDAPLERVITLDRKQPESVLTLEEYLAGVVSKKRISDGQKALAEHNKLLTKIGKKFGVQPRFIVALWGIETNYGRNTGGFNTIDALTTLAYDGRRSDFFRGELIDALKILEEEQMDTSEMKGSWAGALGQCQFMPSTYLKYAVDEDKDGKRDIWGNSGDAFASIANYLESLGWNKDEGWGRPVILPVDLDKHFIDITKEKTLTEWSELGVLTSDGDPLPKSHISASLILVGKDENAVPYLVYGNYKALLEWNKSRFFATSVGVLADEIRSP